MLPAIAPMAPEIGDSALPGKAAQPSPDGYKLRLR